jgi:hypothetical protein
MKHVLVQCAVLLMSILSGMNTGFCAEEGSEQASEVDPVVLRYHPGDVFYVESRHYMKMLISPGQSDKAVKADNNYVFRVKIEEQVSPDGIGGGSDICAVVVAVEKVERDNGVAQTDPKGLEPLKDYLRKLRVKLYHKTNAGEVSLCSADKAALADEILRLLQPGIPRNLLAVNDNAPVALELPVDAREQNEGSSHQKMSACIALGKKKIRSSRLPWKSQDTDALFGHEVEFNKYLLCNSNLVEDAMQTVYLSADNERLLYSKCAVSRPDVSVTYWQAWPVSEPESPVRPAGEALELLLKDLPSKPEEDRHEVIRQVEDLLRSKTDNSLSARLTQEVRLFLSSNKTSDVVAGMELAEASNDENMPQLLLDSWRRNDKSPEVSKAVVDALRRCLWIRMSRKAEMEHPEIPEEERRKTAMVKSVAFLKETGLNIDKWQAVFADTDKKPE